MVSAKLVLEAMGRELFPAIQKIIEIYRKPYIEEIVEIIEGKFEIEESVRLAQIGEVGVWARGVLVIQPYAFIPATAEFEILLEPGERKPRIEARIQWDPDKGPRDLYGIKITDPRILAAFRRIGLELVRKLLTRLQERRAEVEKSPEFREALQELEALVALWGEKDSK